MDMEDIEFDKIIPNEFLDKEILSDYKDKINNRKDDVYRNYESVKKFIENVYDGDLPKDIVSICSKLGYSDMKIDLYRLSEPDFKEKYKDYYEKFNKLPLSEKKKIFVACDFGARTLFEYNQDVVSGNIIEDMVCYYSHHVLRPNKAATSRGEALYLNTKSDLIFYVKNRGKHIKIPIELKNKWGSELSNINIRGNAKTLVKEKSMILTLFTNVGKGKRILIDTSNDCVMQDGNMGFVDKKCKSLEVREGMATDFRFWVDDDMKKLVGDIYKMYLKRENKATI